MHIHFILKDLKGNLTCLKQLLEECEQLILLNPSSGLYEERNLIEEQIDLCDKHKPTKQEY